jgi:hypothetical protein
MKNSILTLMMIDLEIEGEIVSERLRNEKPGGECEQNE